MKKDLLFIPFIVFGFHATAGKLVLFTASKDANIYAPGFPKLVSGM